MNKQLALVRAFHDKFFQPVLAKPSQAPEDRLDFRYHLMKGEVEEYHEAARNGNIEHVAKELGDILYAVFGTILEHGLQDKMEEIFEEVHRSNMSKDYSEYKMIKGPGYVKADSKKILGEQ